MSLASGMQLLLVVCRSSSFPFPLHASNSHRLISHTVTIPHRWRITNVYASGDNVTQIYHLNESKSWYIKTDVKTGAITMCHLLPVPPGVVQPPVAIDPSALDLGPTPTSSEPEERWEAHLTTPSVATAVYDVQAHAAPGRDPMLMRQNTSAYHTVCPRGPGKGKVWSMPQPPMHNCPSSDLRCAAAATAGTLLSQRGA